MAQEVGAAYVTILPTTKGLGKNIEGELGGAFDGTEQKASGRFRGMFGKVAKWGTLAVAGIGASVTALAVKGGISRALNIEDAEAKLGGLGHTTEGVSAIMQDALAAVKGTAFGMDAAATTAAGAVAAGIKPGQQLENYLRLTADAATIAGISMGEMGSIMNKVNANGRAMTENLNQLSDRGIPILGWLADEYGVTTAEMSKMVSQGKVDAETFNRVLEENIGGAALKSGDTTRGAFANMGAALSRVGVTLTSAFVPHFKDVFNQVTQILDGLNDRMGPWAEKFGSWFDQVAGSKIDGLADTVLGFVDGIGAAIDLVSTGNFGSGLREAFGVEEDSPIVGMLMDLMAILNPLGAILKGMAPVFPMLGDALAMVGSQIAEALIPVLPVLADALVSIVDAVAPLLPILGQALVGVIGAVVPLIEQLIPIVVGLLDAFLPILPVVADLVGALLPVLAEIITAVLGAVTPLIPVIADLARTLFPVLADVVMTVLDAIMPLVPVILTLVQAFAPILAIVGELIGALLPPLLDLFMAILAPVLALIAPLVEALAPVLEVIGEVVGEVLVPLLGFLANVLGTVLTAVMPLIAALAVGFVKALTLVIEWVVKAAAAIATFVMNAVGGVKDFAASVGRFLGDAVQWFRDLPAKIREIVSGAGTWLLDTGKKIIQGLIDGLKGAFQNVKDTLSSLTDLLPDWKGPASRDRKLLFGAGSTIIGGLVAGLESEYGAVERSLAGLTDDIAGTRFPALTAGVNVNGGLSGLAGGGNGGPLVQQNNTFNDMDPAVAAEAASRKLEWAMRGRVA